MEFIAAQAARLPPARLIAGLAALLLLTAPLGACKKVENGANRPESALA